MSGKQKMHNKEVKDMEERVYTLLVKESDGTVQEVNGLTIEEYEYLSEKALQNGLEVLA